jgi:hypothetical protein
MTSRYDFEIQDEYMMNILDYFIRGDEYKLKNDYENMKINYDKAFTVNDILTKRYKKTLLKDLYNYYNIENIINREIFYLGLHHQTIDININEMIKYYSMAIKKSRCTQSMYNLGMYYQSVNNIEVMKEYYLMSIKNGHENNIDNEEFNRLFNECKNNTKYNKTKKYVMEKIRKIF